MKSPRPFDVDDISTLPLVYMMSAGRPIHDGQVNRAWSALVQAPESTEPGISVVLKHLPSRVKLAIELGCSLAGQALKLPVPRGMLVLANPAHLLGLPADAVSLNPLGEVLCYGSVLRWPERARARTGDPSVDDFLWQRFCESAEALSGAAWDELVANGDRHAGNFVYDGVGHWLIDHDLALRPLSEVIRRMVDAQLRATLVEHRADRNQVVTQLMERRPDEGALMEQPKSFASRARSLEALAARMPHWKTSIPAVNDVLSDAETVVRSIVARLPALALQLSDRISKPSSSLQWTTETKPLF